MKKNERVSATKPQMHLPLPQEAQMEILAANAEVLHYQRELEKALAGNPYLAGLAIRKNRALLRDASTTFQAVMNKYKVAQATLVVVATQMAPQMAPPVAP